MAGEKRSSWLPYHAQRFTKESAPASVTGLSHELANEVLAGSPGNERVVRFGADDASGFSELLPRVGSMTTMVD